MNNRATWLWVTAMAAPLLGLPQVVQDGLLIALKIYLIGAVGLLFWRGLDAVIESLDALARKYSDAKGMLRYYEDLHSLVPILRRSLEYVIYLFVATLVALQIEQAAPLAELGLRLIRVIGWVFLARLIVARGA